MEKYGCIGKKLTHSFSKEIHAKLADYEYELIELNEAEVAPFLERKEFAAVNVTLPYKQTVIPYLDFVSPIAKRIGAVNTIVHRDGKLYGYNTDYYGLKALIERVGLDLCRKKVLVLGSGGTSKTARAVLEDLKASHILVVSRNKTEQTISYEEAVRLHADANVLINTTPLGMYPDCETKPIELNFFSKLEGVIDVVYNPLRTNLVQEALERNVRAEGGLFMLVMQAVVAVERFLDVSIEREIADRLYASILASKENVVLTGLPGSGKSTVGKCLNLEGFSYFDTDAEIEKRCGCTIRELIETKGEPYFRDLEMQVIREVSSKTGCIISTGGGAVLRQENVRCLKRNGKIYFLDANLSRLQATDSRPLSNTKEKLKRLYDERIDLYRKTADVTVPELPMPQKEAEYIKTKREELVL